MLKEFKAFAARGNGTEDYGEIHLRLDTLQCLPDETLHTGCLGKECFDFWKDGRRQRGRKKSLVTFPSLSDQTHGEERGELARDRACTGSQPTHQLVERE